MSFNWHVYLSETGAEVSPASLFDHVCQSLQPLIREGQTIAAVSHFSENNSQPNTWKWWPAEVVSISGHMVLFKWCLPDSVSSNHIAQPASSTTGSCLSPSGFWFDTKGRDWSTISSIPTTQSVELNWAPPTHLSHLALEADFSSQLDWLESLRKRSVSNIFFEKKFLYFYETIQVGGYFECEHEDNPCFVWPAKVLFNVGGRVKLSWFGMSSQVLPSGSRNDSSFTLFYLHRRIHPLGWGKFHNLQYSPPPGLVPDRNISNVDAFIRNALSAFVHSSEEDGLLDLSKIRPGHPLYRTDPPQHEFKVGWKLEAVNPKRPYAIQPATIAEVFNSRYFLVELDDLSGGSRSESKNENQRSLVDTRIRFVSHACSPEIMPVNTSQLRGLHLVPPPGWPSTRPFTWTNYLTFLSGSEQLRSLKTENGSCKAPSTTTHSSPSVEQTFELKPNTCEPVHSPPPDCSSTATASANTLFCPSESVFKGIPPSNLSFPDPNLYVHSQQNFNPNPPIIHLSEPQDVDTNSCPNDHNQTRFLLGMKLEVVVPDFVPKTNDVISDISPPLCTATVTRVDEPHLLWLLLDIRDPDNDKPLSPIMVDGRSTDLYPVGWAEFVGYPIIPPAGYENCNDDLQLASTHNRSNFRTNEALLWDVGLRPTHDLQYQTITYESEELCPAVYINTKCYLGPFLCRASLDLIPQRFGPGPTARVMHSLLTRLVSVAYKPIRILRMFEADWASGLSSALANFRAAERTTGINHNLCYASRGRFTLQTAKANLRQAEREALEQRRGNMRVVLLRVRCPRRGVKVEAPVEVCCKARAVEEFCRQVSLVLEACPHLLSIHAPIRELTSPNPVGGGTVELTPSLPPLLSGPKQVDSVNFFDATFGYMLDAPMSCECPSFCGSRMRSRNLDRLPGWKRRMFASLRPFGVQPPTSAGQGQSSRGSGVLFANGLRTRSAVAAAQRQHVLGGALSPMRQFSGVSNCLPISKTTKRHRGRVSGRFRDPVRRTSSHFSPQYEVNVNTGCGLKRQYSVVVNPKSDPEHDVALPENEQQVIDPVTVSRNAVNENNSLHCLYKHHPWVNHQVPYINSSVCSSHRFRLSNRSFFTQDHYLQDSSLNSVLSDAPHVTLSSNPLFWSPVDLASYLGETDCREMWPWLAAEAVDGQAFMLLTLPVLHHLVGLRWEDAVRLARHVASVKRAFMEQFSNDTNDIKTS